MYSLNKKSYKVVNAGLKLSDVSTVVWSGVFGIAFGTLSFKVVDAMFGEVHEGNCYRIKDCPMGLRTFDQFYYDL